MSCGFIFLSLSFCGFLVLFFVLVCFGCFPVTFCLHMLSILFIIELCIFIVLCYTRKSTTTIYSLSHTLIHSVITLSANNTVITTNKPTRTHTHTCGTLALFTTHTHHTRTHTHATQDFKKTISFVVFTFLIQGIFRWLVRINFRIGFVRSSVQAYTGWTERSGRSAATSRCAHCEYVYGTTVCFIILFLMMLSSARSDWHFAFHSAFTIDFGVLHITLVYTCIRKFIALFIFLFFLPLSLSRSLIYLDVYALIFIVSVYNRIVH